MYGEKMINKSKRKESNEWPAKRVRILVRCVVEGSGVGGVTRGSLKYLTFFFSLELFLNNNMNKNPDLEIVVVVGCARIKKGGLNILREGMG